MAVKSIKIRGFKFKEVVKKFSQLDLAKNATQTAGIGFRLEN